MKLDVRASKILDVAVILISTGLQQLNRQCLRNTTLKKNAISKVFKWQSSHKKISEKYEMYETGKESFRRFFIVGLQKKRREGNNPTSSLPNIPDQTSETTVY